MSYIKTCRADEIAEGRITAVQTKRGRIGLTRIGDEILAFEDICTHDDGPLGEGALEGEVITCPRHGAQFNIRTGAALKMPATEDIETFAVRISGDHVEVDLE